MSSKFGALKLIGVLWGPCAIGMLLLYAVLWLRPDWFDETLQRPAASLVSARHCLKHASPAQRAWLESARVVYHRGGDRAYLRQTVAEPPEVGLKSPVLDFVVSGRAPRCVFTLPLNDGGYASVWAYHIRPGSNAAVRAERDEICESWSPPLLVAEGEKIRRIILRCDARWRRS